MTPLQKTLLDKKLNVPDTDDGFAITFTDTLLALGAVAAYFAAAIIIHSNLI